MLEFFEVIVCPVKQPRNPIYVLLNYFVVTSKNRIGFCSARGTITFESEVGKGTRFIIRLPAQQQH
ncbi:MAG: hypothetical protein ACM3WQ_06270 [Chloroflexota bacterium]